MERDIVIIILTFATNLEMHMSILIASINFTEIIKGFQIVDWSLCINKQQESRIVNYLPLFFLTTSAYPLLYLKLLTIRKLNEKTCEQDHCLNRLYMFQETIYV